MPHRSYGTRHRPGNRSRKKNPAMIILLPSKQWNDYIDRQSMFEHVWQHHSRMNNDPELNGKYLGTISQDFVKVADSLKEASYQIRRAGFEYPVFVLCKDQQPIGQLLFERVQSSTDWNYYASFLDEFLQRELVAADKKQDFESAYKDPDEFACLFVVDTQFTSFLFIPYPED